MSIVLCCPGVYIHVYAGKCGMGVIKNTDSKPESGARFLALPPAARSWASYLTSLGLIFHGDHHGVSMIIK